MSTGWRRGTLLSSVATSAAVTPRVVKIGGSLLARAGWVAEVRGLVAALRAPLVLVAGGGPLVDGLRAIDAATSLAPDLVHRLAIDCMGLTARVVATALGMPLVVETTPDAPPAVVLDASAWLGRSGRLERLPIGWHVTSDSIAAHVAAEVAGHLLLAKSVPPPHADLHDLAAAGWVDGFFPDAARKLSRLDWAAPD